MKCLASSATSATPTAETRPHTNYAPTAETIEEIAEYIEKTEVKNDTEYWKDEHNIGEMDGFPWGVGFNDRGQTGPSEEVE